MRTMPFKLSFTKLRCGLPGAHLGRRVALGGGAMLCAAAFCGCATVEDSVWQTHFDAIDEEALASTERAQVEQMSYDRLEQAEPPEGFIVVGRSAFREEALDGEDRDAAGALERHGRRIGADLIRWASRPAGQETRVRYVRQRSVGRAPESGTMSTRRDGTTSELIPIEVEVDVYDYLAIYYRRVTDDN